MTAKATPTPIIDNHRVKITHWHLEPDAATGWHRHEYDYVVTPLTTGKLKLVNDKNEEVFAELEAAVPYYRDKGVEHDVINANEFDFAFIETEIK